MSVHLVIVAVSVAVQVAGLVVLTAWMFRPWRRSAHYSSSSR